MKKRQFIQDIINQDREQLEARLVDLRKELADIRMQHRIGRLKDYQRIKSVKKNIARVLFFINEKRKEEIYGS